MVLSLQCIRSEEQEIELLNFFLRHTTDFLSQTDVFGDSIFIIALKNNKYHFAKAILDKHPKIRNKANNEDKTPLMVAIQKQDQPMITFLFKHNTPVNDSDIALAIKESVSEYLVHAAVENENDQLALHLIRKTCKAFPGDLSKLDDAHKPLTTQTRLSFTPLNIIKSQT